MNWVESAIDSLLIQSDLKSRLEQISIEFEIDQTKAIGHCYCVKLDGNQNVRWQDLVEFTTNRIVDYAIPRKDILAAKEHMDKTGSTAKIIELKKKATELFTDLKKTGEGGELLLYILAQEFLNLPQIISKMSLKTTGAMHYQGADGIHVKYNNSEDALELYWGESKMYSDITSGLDECFSSLKGFIIDPYSYKSTQERDLALITSNISQNVADEQLENLLVRYFDKDDDLSNKLHYKGVCFVGFDCKHYPTTPLSTTLDQVKQKITAQLDTWKTSASNKILKHENLKLFEIHLFLIPLPSVQNFREHFLKVLSE